jgi:hypothetical protein
MFKSDCYGQNGLSDPIVSIVLFLTIEIPGMLVVKM